ncbi:MAG: DUF1599 domain-containing protein [Thiotrichales bacterium]|nr:DUF1599 domain-containing protein [Thiotrichales bacterium]
MLPKKRNQGTGDISLKQSTTQAYDQIIQECKDLFRKKTSDYGTAWRVLRLPSITDQILIKAQRIRSIQEKENQKVEDDIRTEFVGIINYCLIAMIQMELIESEELEMNWEKVEPHYNRSIQDTKSLLSDKNHDYDEAWREMRISSMTDIILMKLLRVKQIENNEGKTLVSEGIRSNYQDMINYSVFCLIKLNEE